MKRRILSGWIALLGVALTMAGCAGIALPGFAPQPTATTAQLSTPTGTATARAKPPTVQPTGAPTATATSDATAKPSPIATSTAGPAWWPGDLPMPVGAKYLGESDADRAIPYRLARWTSDELNVDSLRDWFVKEGQAAGYNVTTLPKTNGQSTYDVTFLKGIREFVLHLIGRLGPVTHMDGSALPTLRFKTTGAVSQEVILPLGNWGVQSDLSTHLLTPAAALPTLAAPSRSLHIAAYQVTDQCSACRYDFKLTIPAYEGPVRYTAADVQVNPGLGPSGNYHNPATCVVVVKDEMNGTFECQGLKNQADPAKTIDLSGAWQGPLW